MSISHDQCFGQMIKTIAATGENVLAAVVSADGLVLKSNVDEETEAQLAAVSTILLSQGFRVLNAGGKKDVVQTLISAGSESAVAVTPILHNAFLVARIADKNKINLLVKASLEEVDRLQSLIKNKEITF